MSLKESLKNCSKITPDNIVFNIYYIKLCEFNGNKPIIRNKTYSPNQVFTKSINLTYIKIGDMRDLPFKIKNNYISCLNQNTTYIVCDISECKSNGHVKTHFRTTDFLLGDIKRIKVMEEFFKDHIFFVIDNVVKQYVRTPYDGRVQNYILQVDSIYRYYRIWKIVAAYIEFQHALLFADYERLETKEKRKVLIRALCNNGQAQYEYGSQFEKTNYILYFLWMKESMKNGCRKAYNMDYKAITYSDLDIRTINRYYEEMLEYGFPDAARALYEYENQKDEPNEEKIKRYTEKGFNAGGLMNYYNYAKERCFILGRFDSVVNHEEALQGFRNFFELYDKTDNWDDDKYDLRSLICYMYYAYAGELDVGGQSSPDYITAFKYYKKAAKISDMFDKHILDIGKEFCKGKYLNQNLEHGINLLGLLAAKDSVSAKRYIATLGNRLMKNRQYAIAEKCYRICCGFNRKYCDKYIIAKMYRELEERGNLK